LLGEILALSDVYEIVIVKRGCQLMAKVSLFIATRTVEGAEARLEAPHAQYIATTVCGRSTIWAAKRAWYVEQAESAAQQLTYLMGDKLPRLLIIHLPVSHTVGAVISGGEMSTEGRGR
jgi:hypothetical protein